MTIPPVHIILFILTIFSTYAAYVLPSGLPIGFTTALHGIEYSGALMTILLAHEMGHYFVSRRYGIPTSLPYFIPFPFPPLGTFGAIIKMKGFIVNKKALLDIGVAGPLCGFLVALPFIVVGFKLSTIQKIPAGTTGIRLDDPLLFRILERLMISPLPPNHDLVLHPFAYAGWVGLFVTAFNLLPAGQLDGGHIIYAVFGKKSRWVSGGLVGALVVLAVLYNPGWLVLLILLAIFGTSHPAPLDAETPLDGKRKLLALAMLLVFALSFMPAPFPDFSKELLDLMKGLIGGKT